VSQQVYCLYCGGKMEDGEASCPHCQAPSHFQERGFAEGGRLRFILYFTLFAIAVLLVALWLPR